MLLKNFKFQNCITRILNETLACYTTVMNDYVPVGIGYRIDQVYSIINGILYIFRTAN